MITSHRQARPGKTHANTTLPRHNHPPESKPPSQNSSALQIPNPADNSRPFRPPQTKPPSQSRQNPPSPPNPEGDSTPGGQFGKQKMFPAQENQPDITANFFTWKATPNPLSLTHRPPTTSSDPHPPRLVSRPRPLFPLPKKPRCNSSPDNNP